MTRIFACFLCVNDKYLYKTVASTCEPFNIMNLISNKSSEITHNTGLVFKDKSF